MKLVAIFMLFSTVGTAMVLSTDQAPGSFEMSSTIQSVCSENQKRFLCSGGVRSTRGGSTVFIRTH